MAEERAYRLGAAVYSDDGKHVGRLEGMVVDSGSYVPRALVVKESRGFTGHLLAPGSALLVDEVAIPVDAVAGATEERIDLTLTGDAIRRLPPYLTYRYKRLTLREAALQAFEQIGGPVIPSMEEIAAKEPDELEIDAGENVMLPDGRKVGTVKEVLYEGDVLVGVVVHKGLWAGDVILPRRLLSRSDDLALFADLSAADEQALQPFDPGAGEPHPA